MTQLEEYQAEIRGSHFYPPSKGLLPVLATGCVLELEREPLNPYDINAVKVYVKPVDALRGDQANREMIEFALAGFGRDIDEWEDLDRQMLGHVAKEVAARLSPRLASMSERETYEAVYTVLGNGKPGVLVRIYEGEPR